MTCKKDADSVERFYNAGQTRPTPLLLQYCVDDYNCLQQRLLRFVKYALQITTSKESHYV